MGRLISYDAYVREYMREAAKHDMYSPMFDQEAFEASYRGLANSFREQGLRVQNITRSLIQRQAYELSYSQAKSYATARENLGMTKVSIKSIRLTGKEQALDWEAVKEKYNEYKDAVAQLNAAKTKEQYQEVVDSIDSNILDIIETNAGASIGEFIEMADDVEDLKNDLGVMSAKQYISQVIFGSE